MEHAGHGRAGAPCHEMRSEFCRGKAALHPQTHGHRDIEMATRDVADGVGLGQARRIEGQLNADEADAGLRERCREHRGAAAARDEPKGADELGAELGG